MAADKQSDTARQPEVEEMLAELEGRPSRGAGETNFPTSFQAAGAKGAPPRRWPSGFTAIGGKDSPAPRWTTRFVASGSKFAS